VVDARDAPVGQHGRRVVDVDIEVDEAGDDGDAVHPRSHLAQGMEVVVDEAATEQQVLGWVAGDRKLGEGHEVGALGLRAFRVVEDETGVAVEVADRDVDLGQGDP